MKGELFLQNERSVFHWEVKCNEMENTEDMQSMTKNCICDDDGISLAMAYVMPQQWQKIYESEQGFHKGTIFEELDKPFMGGNCDE